MKKNICELGTCYGISNQNHRTRCMCSFIHSLSFISYIICTYIYIMLCIFISFHQSKVVGHSHVFHGVVPGNKETALCPHLSCQHNDNVCPFLVLVKAIMPLLLCPHLISILGNLIGKEHRLQAYIHMEFVCE